MNQFIQYNNLTANDGPHRGWATAGVQRGWPDQVDGLSLTSFDNALRDERGQRATNTKSMAVFSVLLDNVCHCLPPLFVWPLLLCLGWRLSLIVVLVGSEQRRLISLNLRRISTAAPRMFPDITIVADETPSSRLGSPCEATDRPSAGHGLQRSIRSAWTAA